MIGAFWLFLSAANATTVPRLELRELSRAAEVVVHGQVIRHWPAWDPSHRFIWTHYAIQVRDRLKGGAADTTVISEPGGIVNGMGMKVAGVPEYRDGEEVVVFLHRMPNGYWRCYGLMQGKFTVAGDGGGEKRVRADLSGSDTIETRGKLTGKARTAGTSLESLNGLTLTEFKRRILREVGRP